MLQIEPFFSNLANILLSLHCLAHSKCSHVNSQDEFHLTCPFCVCVAGSVWTWVSIPLSFASKRRWNSSQHSLLPMPKISLIHLMTWRLDSRMSGIPDHMRPWTWSPNTPGKYSPDVTRMTCIPDNMKVWQHQVWHKWCTVRRHLTSKFWHAFDNHPDIPDSNDSWHTRLHNNYIPDITDCREFSHTYDMNPDISTAWRSDIPNDIQFWETWWHTVLTSDEVQFWCI